MKKIMEIDYNSQILERSRGGDLDAFGELVSMHEGWVRGFLRSRIRDWAAADDLAQEVFVTAFRKIRDFRGESEFEGWLRGIAVNLLRNFIRKRCEVCIGGSGELQDLLDQQPREIESGGPALDALHECLSRIDGAARQLLDARYVNGRSVRELSAETGRGYSALTMHLHRLREVLADCVRKKLEVTES